MEMEQRLRDICRSFRIQGSYVESELIPVGNVNKTYKVTYRREEGTLKSYIVQQVNTFVFRKPEQVMHNIDLVTEHIRAKSTEGIRSTFTILPTGKRIFSQTTASGGCIIISRL